MARTPEVSGKLDWRVSAVTVCAGAPTEALELGNPSPALCRNT